MSLLPLTRRAASLALLAALCASAGRARASATLKTQSGASVHWAADAITLGLGARGSVTLPPASVRLALVEAAQAWNLVKAPKPRFAVAELGAPAAAVQVTVDFCKGTWRHQAGLLATTEFKASVKTGEVTEASVLVNECDYRFVGPEEVADGAFDLQAVLTHELGHVLGLGHSEDPLAVMFENTGSVRQRRPGADDRAGLLAIYDPGGAPAVAPAAAAPARTPAAAQSAPGEPSGKPARATELAWDDVEVVGPAAPGKASASPSGAATAAPASAPPAVAARAGGRPRRSAPPADTISAVQLDPGSDVMLYTSDPVILPVFAPARPAAAPPARPPRPRAPAPPAPRAGSARARR